MEKIKIPMSPRSNEVEATMHPIVGDIASIETAFVVQEALELIVHVFDDRPIGLGAVDAVGESRRVHYGEAQLHAAFFDFYSRCLDLDSLLKRYLVIYLQKQKSSLYEFIAVMILQSRTVCWISRRLFRVQIGEEEAVDERRFTQARFAYDHQRELEAFLNELAMDLVW